MSSTHRERVLKAQLAAFTRWSREDAVEGTAPARAAFNRRFELQVDPDGTLPPDERARRVERARTAYFKSLALKSAQARRKRGTAA